MGVTFRSGGYIRHVFVGGRTIKDGEAAAIWNYKGVHTQIIGPRRIWMYSSTIRFLTRHKANSHQYLVVSHRDGRIEYLRGPTNLYENPALHDSVTVQDAIQLDSERDCIFVTLNHDQNSQKIKDSFHSQSNENKYFTKEISTITKTSQNQAAKRVVKGPLVYFPEVGEKIHDFSWSTIQNQEIIENSYKFQILNLCPNRTFSINAPFRTSDLFTFGAKLDFTCQINSLENCVLCDDPIGKMYHAIITDMYPFGSEITKDELLGKEYTDKLSRLDTYPSLLKVANQCGFGIDDVKLIELTFDEGLKAMIKSEHNLTKNLNKKLADEKQKLTLHDLELENRRSSIEKENELKKMQLSLDEELRKKSDSIEQASLNRVLELTKQKVEIEKTIANGYTNSVLSFLSELQEKNVDLTKFMCTPAGASLVLPISSKKNVTGSNEKSKKTTDPAREDEKDEVENSS